MKVIKKITAIMLSIMMVLGMSSVVSAEGATTSGTSTANKGKITIENPIQGQTYTIYQILELESFSDKTTTLPNTGNYAYKVAPEWDDFLTNSAYKGSTYLKKGADGYVTINSSAPSDFADLAKSALQYVKDHSGTSFTTHNKTPDTTGKVEFTDLSLGYYLVDSTAGALCSLDTTDTEVTIQEKNGVPSVKKEIVEGDAIKKGNTASIGDTIKFQTTITAKKGAQNYVLHDKMSEGLTFDKNSVEVKKNGATAPYNNPTDYNIVEGTATGDNCTFHINFEESFCNSIATDTEIIITYSATLNKDAVIAGSGNINTTWLKYGDNRETKHDTTTTKTYEIPVFKYTNKGGGDIALANATFKLSKNDDGTDEIKIKQKASETNVYLVDPSGTTEITTDTTGKFKIQGLAAGIYYLTETKQPDGYNKLTSAVKIEITSEGKIKVNDGVEQEPTDPVKVENNTGSLLPSTGGMGTTLFYIFGAILVIGSGVVLITKKRMK